MIPSDTFRKDHCICFDDVIQASRRIDGIAHKTPVMTCASLDERFSSLRKKYKGDDDNYDDICRRRLFFKMEAMQRTGSFKFRGALNSILAIVDSMKTESKGKAPLNVVTHSSGNHAQALAMGAKLASQKPITNTVNNDISTDEAWPRIKVNATIVMPRTAPEVKRCAVEAFGGEIVLVDGEDNASRANVADTIVQERSGAVFVHPSEDLGVIAGQGTVCLEFVAQVRDMLRPDCSGDIRCSLDAVIIPVGGGGLAAGNAITLRSLLGDRVKIILAEPSVMDDAKRSKEAGKLLGHDEGNDLKSVADGLKTTLGPNTWPIIRDLVDDIITVTEKEILRSTKLIWERLKVCIEPSAGVGVAVAMGEEFTSKYTAEDGIVNVGVILCGGNVDVIKVSKLMEEMGID